MFNEDWLLFTFLSCFHYSELAGQKVSSNFTLAANSWGNLKEVTLSLLTHLSQFAIWGVPDEVAKSI